MHLINYLKAAFIALVQVGTIYWGNEQSQHEPSMFLEMPHKYCHVSVLAAAMLAGQGWWVLGLHKKFKKTTAAQF